MGLHLIISNVFIAITVSQKIRKFGGVGNGRGRSYIVLSFLVQNEGVIQSEFVLFRVIILSDYSYGHACYISTATTKSSVLPKLSF